MKATARISVTLDIPIPDTWADGTDIAVIRNQAVTSGVEHLRNLLNCADRIDGHRHGVRLVGDPKVTIILEADP
jgi:hypothetical protein